MNHSYCSSTGVQDSRTTGSWTNTDCCSKIIIFHFDGKFYSIATLLLKEKKNYHKISTFAKITKHLTSNHKVCISWKFQNLQHMTKVPKSFCNFCNIFDRWENWPFCGPAMDRRPVQVDPCGPCRPPGPHTGHSGYRWWIMHGWKLTMLIYKVVILCQVLI